MIVSKPHITTNGAEAKKTVADPTNAYLSMKTSWAKSRAVCNGEAAVKAFDSSLDTTYFQNLLIPFSPSMTQRQYDWYKSEAELPGIVAQYAKVIVGGLLRKKPTLELPEGVPADAKDWIMDRFCQDSSPLLNFLDQVLWEEMQTSRAWIYVDYPNISKEDQDKMTPEEAKEIKPYPVLWKAESIVNHRVGTSSIDGSQELKMVIVRNYEETYLNDDDPHPTTVDTVYKHYIDDRGHYVIQKYKASSAAAGVPVEGGENVQNYQETSGGFEKDGDLIEVIINDEPATVIPAWPINGNIGMTEPILMALINREISLYNKMSRRNHLLYGASTYTPWIASGMTDEKFEDVVNGGLGTWIHIEQGDTIGVLETPTAALQDMDVAIKATIEELAKMGIRMLSPEVDQSGVALEIRNAAQTAQLGTLNAKVSSQMSSIIAFMLNWRYDLELKSTDVIFKLSDDFNPAPLGADWLRLITEWYEGGLIPRSIWLAVMKQNDIVPPEYDDKEGQAEIDQDPLVVNKREDMEFQAQLAKETMAMKQGSVPPKAPAKAA